MDVATFADDDIPVDLLESIDNHVVGKLCIRMDVCETVDFSHNSRF